jgi:GNAT superfamily N-acetyltransferase
MYIQTLKNGFSLKSGYQHGLVGKVTALHGQSYVEKYSFGKFFECKVATELSAFVQNYNSDNSEIWSITKDDEIFGSITVDGSHASQTGAHLRWFILDPKAKGMGFGRLLLETAIEFCKRRNFASIYLWTLAGQEPAGTLYRKTGFELEESLMGDQWGIKVEEERLRLIL